MDLKDLAHNTEVPCLCTQFLPMVTFYLLTTVLHNPRVTECPLISSGLHVLSCTYVYGYRAMQSYHIGKVL